MNKQKVEQVIRELFRENYRLYPESYPLTDAPVNNMIRNEKKEFLVPDQTVVNAHTVAQKYWAVRVDTEIERDEKAGVTESDYVEWVMAELSDLIHAAE